MSERKEAWMRIIVLIISGIILGLWRLICIALSLFNFIYAIFSGKRNKAMAEFCNLWINEAYKFLRYMTFATNKRPFPFNGMEKPMHSVDIKN